MKLYTTTATFLLFSRRHHIFIAFPPPAPPPHFYCFPSTTTTTTTATFLLFSLHHHHNTYLHHLNHKRPCLHPWRSRGSQVVREKTFEPRLPTLTRPFSNNPATTDSWLGTRKRFVLFYPMGQQGLPFFFVCSYTTAIISPYLSGSFTGSFLLCPYQKRRNWWWFGKTFQMLSAGPFQFAPRPFCHKVSQMIFTLAWSIRIDASLNTCCKLKFMFLDKHLLNTLSYVSKFSFRVDSCSFFESMNGLYIELKLSWQRVFLWCKSQTSIILARQ